MWNLFCWLGHFTRHTLQNRFSSCCTVHSHALSNQHLKIYSLLLPKRKIILFYLVSSQSHVLMCSMDFYQGSQWFSFGRYMQINAHTQTHNDKSMSAHKITTHPSHTQLLSYWKQRGTEPLAATAVSDGCCSVDRRSNYALSHGFLYGGHPSLSITPLCCGSLPLCLANEMLFHLSAPEK